MPRHDWEPELAELIDALELYNDNTDSATVPAGGEKIYVFVWPPEGGRDGEWQLLSHVNPKKHQKEYGGKFAEVRIPGHEGGFNAFKAAVDAMRTLGIKVSNPELDTAGIKAAGVPTPIVSVGSVPGLKKNPSAEYRWFVVIGARIFSGWEFGSDAKDDLRDNRRHYFNVGHGEPKIVSRSTLNRMGVDPDDTDNWHGYAPATVATRSR